MAAPSWPPHLRTVVFVCVDFPTVSGGSRYVETFGDILVAAGLSVEVVSLYPGTQPSSLPHRSVYPERALFKYPVSLGLSGLACVRAIPRFARKHAIRLARARRAGRWLQRRGPDALVVFTHVLALEEMQALGFDPRSCRATLVGQHHSSFSTIDVDATSGEALPRLFGTMDGMTALSAEDAQLFEERVGVPVRGIPNPASATADVPSAAWADRPARLITLARFSPEKRLPLLVELVARAFADPRTEGWHFDIFGEGGCEDELRRAVASSGAADRITVHVATQSPEQELANSRINLLASRHEGFGLSLLEAACAGVPSVAFDVSPGVHDLMSTLGGDLITEGDEGAYVAALVELMTRDGHGQAASRRALQGAQAYSPAEILVQWGRALHEFSAGAASRR